MEKHGIVPICLLFLAVISFITTGIIFYTPGSKNLGVKNKLKTNSAVTKGLVYRQHP